MPISGTSVCAVSPGRTVRLLIVPLAGASSFVRPNCHSAVARAASARCLRRRVHRCRGLGPGDRGLRRLHRRIGLPQVIHPPFADRHGRHRPRSPARPPGMVLMGIGRRRDRGRQRRLRRRDRVLVRRHLRASLRRPRPGAGQRATGTAQDQSSPADLPAPRSGCPDDVDGDDPSSDLRRHRHKVRPHVGVVGIGDERSRDLIQHEKANDRRGGDRDPPAGGSCASRSARRSEVACHCVSIVSPAVVRAQYLRRRDSCRAIFARKPPCFGLGAFSAGWLTPLRLTAACGYAAGSARTR